MRGDWGVTLTCITNTRTESKMHQEYNSMVLAINRWVHLGQQAAFGALVQDSLSWAGSAATLGAVQLTLALCAITST